MQRDHVVKARILGIIVVYKTENNCRVDDIAIPGGEKLTN